jgi:hypothetical protein
MTIPQEQEWANKALADELHNIIAATIPTIVATRNRVGGHTKIESSPRPVVLIIRSRYYSHFQNTWNPRHSTNPTRRQQHWDCFAHISITTQAI